MCAGVIHLGRFGQLLVKCPGCGRVYPSGIVTDFEMVERNLNATAEVTTRCSFCGRENSSELGKMAFTTAAFGLL